MSQQRAGEQTDQNDAYLVLRDGNQFGEEFRLTAGHVITIGRAATNRIVLRDDICSRNHCEVFFVDDNWVVRDLGSRNGTLLGRRQVIGDEPLDEGSRIRIGACELIYTTDPTNIDTAIGRLDDPPTHSTARIIFPRRDEPENSEAPAGAPEIVHRRRQTRFGELSRRDAGLRDRVSRELAMLYRLALEMGRHEQEEPLCVVVVDTLLEATPADVGAILLQRPGTKAKSTLDVAAFRAPADAGYDRVSEYLSEVVSATGEAVLAHDVSEDQELAARDSLGRMQAQSVICAPIRFDGAVQGLVHLYATNPGNPVDLDDLEFTLAVADQLGVAIEGLRRRRILAENLDRAEAENENLREQLQIESELVGQSPAMDSLRGDIAHAAPTDATVLIRGESGVGKELVARAIHLNSRRKAGPFVCLNCAALTESILESELFGHEKGAFTGATARKVGKFEASNGGTLFLDEVGEMSPAIQSKFLRVLEGHAFERVGGNQSIHSDVRVVAATNRDLEEAVEQGQFRRDLYFRVHVVTLDVEPLRNRPTDIELLAKHFLKRLVGRSGRPIKGYTKECVDLLKGYDWPGNVRELQNAIERAVILARGERIDARDIRLSRLGAESEWEGTRGASNNGESYRPRSLESVEKDHILATLGHTDWNKSQASQILGIERSTLDRKLKRYKVRRPSS